MGKIKSLAGETVLYGLGSIIPRFLNFLLIRPHTNVFHPAEYGVLTNLMVWVALLNVVFMFGMETAYFRFATKPNADEKRIFNLALTVVIGISLFCSIILISLAHPIANALNIPEKSHLIIWLTAIMFIDALVAIPFARLRLQKKALRFALGKLINITILIGLNLYFLKVAYTPGRGVDFVILANLYANAFFILFFLRTLLQWRPAYDSSLTPTMFTYSYPVMLTGLAGMTSETFSRTTLEWWLPANFYPGKSSAYALGVFGACYKFAVLMNLAVTAFRYAAEPFFFSNAEDKNSPALFARINHYFILVCCVLLLAVGINLDILKHLFLGREEYWEGLHIVPILLLGYLLIGVYYNMSVWFKLTDKTYYGTIIMTAGAILTIITNYVLIPIAGYEGSSWATLICSFAMVVGCYLLGQKYYPIPYTIGKDLAYIVITTVLVYAVNAVHLESQLWATSFHIVIILLYLAVIYKIEVKELLVARH